ncbi:tetratricopeptide repeat protein 27-like isoform X2 [Acanthaster planci]|uniref:Tetratricopeptide repeat protein 27-like isoform X2 n=1 Tax=Acanthaster planci TaxID=133434 RepID=A0A8B7XQN6_ACAPL|nr:tetratricopeptide repeat protein 27-like isoform X2 [Acanthaster planci]
MLLSMELPSLQTNLEILLLETGHSQFQTKSSIAEIIGDGSLRDCSSSLFKGDFEQVLLGGVAVAILGSEEDNLGDALDFTEFIQRRVKLYLQKSEPEELTFRELCVMYVGVASLQLFIQSNWTGPPCRITPADVLPKSLCQETNVTEFREFATSTLSPDDSSIYRLVTHPEFLLMAHCILVNCNAILSSCLTADWWTLRCLWIQQQVLDERSPLIHKEVHELMDTINQNEVLMSREKCIDLPLIFHLECCHICQYYYEFTKAREHLHTAKKTAGLEASLSGALGKRTRFQETDKAQLFLRVQHQEDWEESAASSREEDRAVKGLPKDLNLDDDTLLDTVKFKDSDVDQIPRLTSAEQALILALCTEHKRSRPKEELLWEELKAYIVVALTRPKVWSVQALALMTRCQLEKDHGRTVERAMMQMQLLVDQFKESECPVINRLELLHAVCLPPKWTMEGELASLLMSLGVVTAALEVYVRLEMWEDVIKCYRLLEKPDKAVKVIRDQLAIKETPTLWCLLGDFKKDKQYYEKAWEVSGQRNARAMRSLGLQYLEEENWEKSIECLEISLQKNPVQYHAWFWLGYSATKANNHETAAKAYRKCVTLESDNGKAWNNLSSAYINLKQKPRAFKTLQEAIRCLYENWKIWENYMVVSVDIGEFGEAIKAFHRLMDLREKYLDEDVLGILVNAVIRDIVDADGNRAGILKGRLVELFGRLTSQVTTNARVWKLYAKLHGNARTDSAEHNDRALQCLQKAHRLQTQRGDWSSEIQSCRDILEQSVELAQAYQHCSSNKTNSAEAIQLLSSAKLMLKSVISKTKYPEDSPIRNDLAEPLETAETEQQRVVDMIAQRKE